MANRTNSTAAPKKAHDGISKQEAVRRALAELGKDAKPTRIQGWVKDEYAIDMTTDHISTAKGQILRKARRKKRAATKPPLQQSMARKEEAEPAAAQLPVRPALAPQRNGITLDDIEAVQGLVGRVGTDGLKRLIDVLAR
jgi:hypothetical protein